MLGHIDFAGQYDRKPFGDAAGLRQNVTLAVRTQCAEVSDALNLRPVQDRKHLVSSRFDGQTCGYSHVFTRSPRSVGTYSLSLKADTALVNECPGILSFRSQGRS